MRRLPASDAMNVFSLKRRYHGVLVFCGGIAIAAHASQHSSKTSWLIALALFGAATILFVKQKRMIGHGFVSLGDSTDKFMTVACNGLGLVASVGSAVYGVTGGLGFLCTAFVSALGCGVVWQRLDEKEAFGQ